LSGERIVVEGDGVVGKCPHLKPGESFSYNSYHVVAGPSTAEGAYFGLRDDGLPVYTRIPSFDLIPPE
jgi:ApaG protein